MQNLIEGMLLERPAPSIASVRRNLLKICEQEKWQVPSYSVIYDIAQEIDPALIMLAHEGVKAYNNAYDLVYRREATRPNEI
ncbi:Mu transposase C-terminal domain-containing protein, partial [Enterococcus faecium]